MKKNIRIVGSGPSGLSASIFLAKAGFSVEVFEKNDDAGKRFSGDLQGLENWSEKSDVLEDLKKFGLKINFDCDPFEKLIFTNGKDETVKNFKKPIFYLVKRGAIKGSLDQGLKKQAIEHGVKINFQNTIPLKEADIIATGPITNKIFAIDKGIVFKTSMSDTAIALINNQAAYKGYAYLLVTNGYGCLCTMVLDCFEKVNNCFEEAKKTFEKIVRLDIQDPRPTGGIGSFSLEERFKIGNSLLVGESAGLQDFFAGFGIRKAITSAHLAAESIIENKNYEELARKAFSNKLKSSLVIRYFWEKASLMDYNFILKKTKNCENIFDFLYSFHNFNKIERISYPFIWIDMKIKKRI